MKWLLNGLAFRTPLSKLPFLGDAFVLTAEKSIK